MLGGVKIDPTTFRPVLPQQPDQSNLEYLYVDDGMLPPQLQQNTHRPSGSWGPLPMRTDGDKMLYGTGAAYLAGISSGGFYGFVKGLQHPNATTFKLKINSVLNLCTRYGPWAGNHAGVMGGCCVACAFTLASIGSLTFGAVFSPYVHLFGLFVGQIPRC